MGILKRKQNWTRLLLRAVEEKASTRFQPGVHDCCIAACDIVQAMTGVDVAAQFRDTYSTKEEMQDIVESNDGVEAMFEKEMIRCGAEEILVSQAGRGDFVMLAMPDGHTISVVSMDGINVVACGSKGWEEVPIKRYGVRAWRVG